KMFQYFVDKTDCAHHQIFPGVDIYTTCCQQMMISLVEMRPHAVVELHHHPHEQMGMMLEGAADFTIGDQQMRVTAGSIWRIPGGVPHKIVALDKPVRAIDVFHPPREDYK
ncbi:MAG: cupin domain-containing protein, partial [Pirellulales bacterium]